MDLQEDEWLSGFADEPLCTVLSNNHNFHLTGKWYDERCSESGYGFVCQKPQGKIPSVSLSLILFCLFFITSLDIFHSFSFAVKPNEINSKNTMTPGMVARHISMSTPGPSFHVTLRYLI